MFSRQIQHWKSSVQGSLGRFLSEQIEFQEKDTHLEKLKRMKASRNADRWRAATSTVDYGGKSNAPRHSDQIFCQKKIRNC